MNGRPAPEQPVFVPAAGVVGRKSTDVLAVKDKCVADALEFLWSHIQQDPSVNDVATAIGTNRRQLERLFKKELGRGVNAEMRRRRLVEFCRLLRSSDDPLVDLSLQVGYKSQESMHRHFRQAMGLTPREYRKQMRFSNE